MTRYAACVSYNGAQYHGWQKLANHLPTVQQHVERALSQVGDHGVSVICAGRTDAGVHATRQIIHFDSEAKRSERNWVFGANRYLPADISIHWVRPVGGEFHARFTALSRRYIYIIYNHIIRSSHYNKEITWYHKPLNADAMQAAGNLLLGKHDFNAYRTVHCQASHAVRTVQHLKVQRAGRLVILDIQANAFLHHMVRNIAGVLMAIGSGKYEPVWAREVLISENRCCGGVTAPAHGLYFVDVLYPQPFLLPVDDMTGPPVLVQHGTFDPS